MYGGWQHYVDSAHNNAEGSDSCYILLALPTPAGVFACCVLLYVCVHVCVCVQAFPPLRMQTITVANL